jgi:hypothetical protein
MVGTMAYPITSSVECCNTFSDILKLILMRKYGLEFDYLELVRCEKSFEDVLRGKYKTGQVFQMILDHRERYSMPETAYIERLAEDIYSRFKEYKDREAEKQQQKMLAAEKARREAIQITSPIEPGSIWWKDDKSTIPTLQQGMELTATELEQRIKDSETVGKYILDKWERDCAKKMAEVQEKSILDSLLHQACDIKAKTLGGIVKVRKPEKAPESKLPSKIQPNKKLQNGVADTYYDPDGNEIKKKWWEFWK